MSTVGIFVLPSPRFFVFSSVLSDGQRRNALNIATSRPQYTLQLCCYSRVQCYAFNMLIVLLKPFIMT